MVPSWSPSSTSLSLSLLKVFVFFFCCSAFRGFFVFSSPGGLAQWFGLGVLCLVLLLSPPLHPSPTKTLCSCDHHVRSHNIQPYPPSCLYHETQHFSVKIHSFCLSKSAVLVSVRPECQHIHRFSFSSPSGVISDYQPHAVYFTDICDYWEYCSVSFSVTVTKALYLQSDAKSTRAGLNEAVTPLSLVLCAF